MAEFVQAAKNEEWEKVEVRRPLEAVAYSEFARREPSV
jgi:hypothetical protein